MRTDIAFLHNVQFRNVAAFEAQFVGAARQSHFFLQELCESTANSLRNFLQIHGYHVAVYSPNNYKKHECSNSIYPWTNAPAGNQIVASLRGYIGSYVAQKFPVIRPGQHNGFVCALMLGSYPQYLCSTHHDSSNSEINIAQGNYLYNWLMGRPLHTTRTVVGGDFNRRPNQEPVVRWKGAFYEVDQVHNRSTHASSNPTKKIDYIFARKTDLSVNAEMASVNCGGVNTSDHCFVKGVIRVHR